MSQSQSRRRPRGPSSTALAAAPPPPLGAAVAVPDDEWDRFVRASLARSAARAAAAAGAVYFTEETTGDDAGSPAARRTAATPRHSGSLSPLDARYYAVAAANLSSRNGGSPLPLVPVPACRSGGGRRGSNGHDVNAAASPSPAGRGGGARSALSGSRVGSSTGRHSRGARDHPPETMWGDDDAAAASPRASQVAARRGGGEAAVSILMALPTTDALNAVYNRRVSARTNGNVELAEAEAAPFQGTPETAEAASSARRPPNRRAAAAPRGANSMSRRLEFDAGALPLSSTPNDATAQGGNSATKTGGRSRTRLHVTPSRQSPQRQPLDDGELPPQRGSGHSPIPLVPEAAPPLTSVETAAGKGSAKSRSRRAAATKGAAVQAPTPQPLEPPATTLAVPPVRAIVAALAKRFATGAARLLNSFSRESSVDAAPPRPSDASSGGLGGPATANVSGRSSVASGIRGDGSIRFQITDLSTAREGPRMSAFSLAPPPVTPFVPSPTCAGPADGTKRAPAATVAPPVPEKKSDVESPPGGAFVAGTVFDEPLARAERTGSGKPPSVALRAPPVGVGSPVRSTRVRVLESSSAETTQVGAPRFAPPAPHTVDDATTSPLDDADAMMPLPSPQLVAAPLTATSVALAVRGASLPPPPTDTSRATATDGQSLGTSPLVATFPVTVPAAAPLSQQGIATTSRTPSRRSAPAPCKDEDYHTMPAAAGVLTLRLAAERTTGIEQDPMAEIRELRHKGSVGPSRVATPSVPYVGVLWGSTIPLVATVVPVHPGDAAPDDAAAPLPPPPAVPSSLLAHFEQSEPRLIEVGQEVEHVVMSTSRVLAPPSVAMITLGVDAPTATAISAGVCTHGDAAISDTSPQDDDNTESLLLGSHSILIDATTVADGDPVGVHLARASEGTSVDAACASAAAMAQGDAASGIGSAGLDDLDLFQLSQGDLDAGAALRLSVLEACQATGLQLMAQATDRSRRISASLADTSMWAPMPMAAAPASRGGSAHLGDHSAFFSAPTAPSAILFGDETNSHRSWASQLHQEGRIHSPEAIIDSSINSGITVVAAETSVMTASDTNKGRRGRPPKKASATAAATAAAKAAAAHVAVAVSAEAALAARGHRVLTSSRTQSFKGSANADVLLSPALLASRNAHQHALRAPSFFAPLPIDQGRSTSLTGSLLGLTGAAREQSFDALRTTGSIGAEIPNAADETSTDERRRLAFAALVAGGGPLSRSTAAEAVRPAPGPMTSNEPSDASDEDAAVSRLAAMAGLSCDSFYM